MYISSHLRPCCACLCNPVFVSRLQEGSTPKGSTSCASVGNSYLVNLAKVSSLKLASDCAVRAMTFLHGYTEPVLLLLHETPPTWGGR